MFSKMMRAARLLALASLALPVFAHADGQGVRAGDLVFHPRAWVATGYDSNVFRESADHEDVNEAAVIRVGGGLSMQNRSPNKIALGLDTRLTYRHFAAVNELDDVSSAIIASRNGLSDATAKAMVGLFPRSVVSLKFSDDFKYTERPPYSELDGVIAGLRRDGKFDEILGFEKIDNAVGVELSFRPGSGERRPIELSLGYRFRLVRFVDGDFIGASRGNRDSHELSLLSRWRFLPKTAAELKVDFDIHDYQQPALVVALNPDGTNQFAQSGDRDSAPLRITLGLRGLITKRLSALMQGGYSNSFNSAADSFSMAVGKLELQYVLEPTLTTRVGYEHDARPSAFSNFVVVDRVYGGGELHFLGGFTLGVSAGLGYYSYATAGSPEASVEGAALVERTDPVVRAKVRLAYNIRNWLTTEVTWQLEANLTDYSTRDLGANDPDHADYSRQNLMLMVQAVY